MTSGDTLEREVAGPVTLLSLQRSSLLTLSYLFDMAKNPSKTIGLSQKYLFFPVSISMATITVISENIIFCYTFIFKMSFGQKGIKSRQS